MTQVKAFDRLLRAVDLKRRIDSDLSIGPMEETGNQDPETVHRQSVNVTDRDEEIRECHGNQHSVREAVSCRGNGDGKLSSGTSQRQMGGNAAHRGHVSTRSSPVSSSDHLDDVAVQSGTPEEQPDRLRPSGTPVEPVTENGEEDITRRDALGSQVGLRTIRSPSAGLLNPKYGTHTVTKGPSHGYKTDDFRSEGSVNVRSSKSPPSPGPTSRVTAFSVADILHPEKFGCDRRERVADSRLNEPRDPRSAAAAHQELWTPWMRRLELHLRAGATGIGNINFLRGIGQ